MKTPLQLAIDENAVTLLLSAASDYYQSEFGEEIETGVRQVVPTGDPKLYVVDADNDSYAFDEIALQVGLLDEFESAIENQAILQSQGWKLLDSPEDSNALMFYKDGVIYSFADDSSEWFPPCFILIVDLQ